MAGFGVVSPASARKRLTFLGGGMTAVLAVALAKFLFHVWFNNRYGYFRDEFDYISCAFHPAWGYVDQPPLIPFLTRISIAVFGDSLRAIRLIPAIASSLLVIQTAALAREFGGRSFALLLSAVTILVAPQCLSNGSLLGTNCLEPILWMGCAWFALRAISRNDPRYWLWFGIGLGIGLEEKYTIALFGFSIAAGLLLTPARRAFLSIWLWLGAIAAFLILLPNLLWNFHNDWPFLQLMHNIRAEGRDVILPAGQYFLQQALLIHPFTAPIWLCGLVAFFVSPRLKPYRLFGWSYLICYGVLFTLHGKNYYLAPIYPLLLAGGAVSIEAALDSYREPLAQSIQWATILLLLATGAWLAPITVPVFSRTASSLI